MRVADYIFRTLADWGVSHVFFVSGGGAMHLNDALGREKRIQYVCNLHEQACAMAAEGYARISGMPGVINVTTGPGGTNALTGVVGAWQDSIPMLVISGQVKTATTVAACPELPLRQLGDQELNIVDIVRPVTKYAAMITAVDRVRPALERAWYEARSGRPGPVWLDIPLNIQAAEMTPKDLNDGFVPTGAATPPVTEVRLAEVVAALRRARRPVMVAGIGVRHGGAVAELHRLAENCHIPLLTAISGVDLTASDDPWFFGRPGIMGARAANFIMQNADLLLVLGTRMGIRMIGYAYETVARGAYKIMVDADAAELQKPTFCPDCLVHAEVGELLRRLNCALPSLPESAAWLDYCRRLRREYPVVTAEHRARRDYVSSYVLPELLVRYGRGDEIVVTGNGSAYTSTFQAIPLRRGMRMFGNAACAAMGYGLPAAIGAAFAGRGRRVWCLTGDGSIQMNLQELQTVKNYRLPLKIFVYNNAGYLSIKLTQKAFFNGNFVGSEAHSGIILPCLEKLAAAYGLPFFRLTHHTEAERLLPEILAADDPALIEVMTDPFEELGPKAASKKLPDGTMVSAPLEDLFPFLPRPEFRQNMLIDPILEAF
ncbi:MAG: thiamine pyrophosphate-binding protein [Victivallales bacterium]|nr:thiamine pyrophosphate-binding protein [Victivallales bacterium]